MQLRTIREREYIRDVRTVNPPSVPSQVLADADTLLGILAGLHRLQAEWSEARGLVQARQRGYFTPDEDDLARQQLLTYRNYRIALWDIIQRSLHYESLADPCHRATTFLVGFAAGLVLYQRSLQIVAAYEHLPLVRAKLNEPEPRFGLEAGFFDEILRNYTSLSNYRLIARGYRDWRKIRRLLGPLDLAARPPWTELAQLVRRERSLVRSLFLQVLRLRLRHDWRFFLRSLLAPIASRAERIQAAVGEGFGQLHFTSNAQAGLPGEVLAALRNRLQPGDVFLVRGDARLTAALLPGFWTHAAIFLGNTSEVAALRSGSDPRWSLLDRHPLPSATALGQVIEGVAPRVTLSSTEQCIEVDHLIVLRPRCTDLERREALAEALSHLGKPYDFEFDFNTGDRLVCTELVYRAFHRRGGIRFQLTKRLGRFTLSGDDIVAMTLDAAPGAEEGHGFDVLAVVLRIGDQPPRLLEENEVLPKLRAIRKGWRPRQAGAVRQSRP